MEYDRCGDIMIVMEKGEIFHVHTFRCGLEIEYLPAGFEGNKSL